MSRSTEAMPNSSWAERFFVLAFLCGAAWSGYRLVQIQKAPVPEIVSETEPAPKPVGSEWNEVHLFKVPPAVHHWEQAQKTLSRKLAPVLDRRFTLERVYGVFAPNLNELNHFDDYVVKPLLPLPGANFRLKRGPECFDFEWTPIPLEGVTYTLEIAKNRNFTHFRTFGSRTNRLRIQAHRQGDFFWRIRATQRREIQVSEASSFMVLEPPIPEAARRRRDLAMRVVDPNAWLADLRFCR